MTCIPLRAIVTLQRHASQEPRYALLVLDPVVHQIRQILWATLTLPDQLHLHAFRVRRWLKDERRIEVVHRGDAYLPIIIKCKFESEDRSDRFPELGTF